MKIYMAGIHGTFDCYVAPEIRKENHDPIFDYKPYMLESFVYCNKVIEKLIPMTGDFLLDSGAFTFMQSNQGQINWDDYVERYADFINRNKIDKFFELDIDSIVGYDRVKDIRQKLERLTDRQSIPVWHSNRGMDEFRRMCDEYPYVALGGIVGKEWKASAEKFIPCFIKEAHQRGAKIHGLGFTKMKLLPQYHFDSVDSTAWTAGNQFGFVYKFDGKTMQKKHAPAGHKLKDGRTVAVHNYIEWLKFQKYAEGHL